MCFNSGIRLVNCNINSTITCISIRAFDQSTTILIQQLHVFQYLFAWIGLIKALKLIVNEQLRHAFFCRLVREITGKIASAGVNMCYMA